MENEIHEQTFEVSSPASLLVKNIRGDIKVVPGKDGVIKVKAVKELSGGDPDITSVVIVQESSGRVKAAVEVPDKIFGIFNKPVKVHFEIEAPVITDIVVKCVSGSIDVRGFQGSMDLNTVSGPMVVEDLTGELDLDSVSGKITGKGLSGSSSISVVSGKINLKDCQFPALKASAVSGAVAIQTSLEDGPYKLSAVSGSLRLVVPTETQCYASASAVSGRFYTDLTVSQSKINRRSWKVKVGEGGPKVKMSTVSGSMRLVSSFDSRGAVPSEVQMNEKDRTDILTQLSDGEISVDEAAEKLAAA